MAQGNAPRLRRREPRRYIGTDMLKIIGLLLTVQGTVGVALLQNGLLNMGGQTRLELWDLIQTDQNAAQVLAWSVLPIKGIKTGKVRRRKVFVYIMHEERPFGVPSSYYMRTCAEGYRYFGFDFDTLVEAAAYSKARTEGLR